MTSTIFLSSFTGALLGTLLLTIGRHQWRQSQARRWLGRAIAIALYLGSLLLLQLQLDSLQAFFTWLGMLSLGAMPAIFLSPRLIATKTD